MGAKGTAPRSRTINQRGRFTLSFEAHVIALLQQCRTVGGAARLARFSEDAADGVMRRAVERGLLRR